MAINRITPSQLKKIINEVLNEDSNDLTGVARKFVDDLMNTHLKINERDPKDVLMDLEEFQNELLSFIYDYKEKLKMNIYKK